ncbi:unnamed protein product [Blepharisma stoltei]|uniref:Uncharacterized protein n=1 Tax=Blepharisma stoltei TaxID=1481888 RepID=A0AAU9JX28_9CILI|nr:unnamed protein product [Blepharisma stoltei]
MMLKKEIAPKIKTSKTPSPISKIVTTSPSPPPIEKLKPKKQPYKKKRSKSSMDFRNKNKSKHSWAEDLVKIDKEELKLKRTIKQLNNKCKMIIEKTKHHTPPPLSSTIIDKKQDLLDKSILNISRTIRNLSNKCKLKFDKLSHIIKSPKHNIVRLRK